MSTQLNSVALCKRSYDPFDSGYPNQFGERRKPEDAIFTRGETYACRAQCDGWCEIEDNFGVLHSMPNAAFSSYFRFL